MPCALDMAGRHQLVLSGGELELLPPDGDRRSRCHEALLRGLSVGEARFSATGRAPVGGGAVDVVLDDLFGPLVVARVREGTLESVYRLSPFELRYAEDNAAIHAVPRAARTPVAWRPRTDLHSHFAACVAPTDLVELGVAHRIAFPRELLEAAGLLAGEASTRLADLPPGLRARLASRLAVPVDRRVTFPAMEEIYRLRGPLTKAPELFVPLCRRIAEDYARQGIAYAELSLGSVLEARVLREIQRELPAIERASGTQLRFLLAISRHDDPEWDLDLVERLREVGASRFIAGVDFMGHETNSTSAFAHVIRAIADWADMARPGFVVRVHAGESPSHPENVRLALEAVAGRSVLLRIGHGLYGVDEPTLDAIVRTGAIVEFNLDSNVALNHLQSAHGVELRRYVDRGARVVLGSDGYGLYGTSPEGMVRAALIAGLDPSQLAHLEAVETAYLTDDRRALPAACDVPDDPPAVHFTPAVVERRLAAKAARRRELEGRLATIGVPLLARGELEVRIGRRELVSIAGAWRQSWEAMSAPERTLTTKAIEAFVATVDPALTVLVTGGTRFGVEGVAGRAARARGIEVIAAVVEATPPDGLDGMAMSSAYVVGDTLYEKAAGLYALVAGRDGRCLFIGGGQIVSDEIQTARNLHLRYLLFVGAGGASARHAAERPAHAVRSGAEIADALVAWRSLDASVTPHWFDGPNPTVDLVVLREGAVLLVLRDREAPAAPNEWALPGGYVASGARRGERWAAAEAAEDAAVRELAEETGLVIAPERLVAIGTFEGGDRDPRDDPKRWARSTAYLVELAADERPIIAGGDDASHARWFALDRLPSRLAFDHSAILAAAIAAQPMPFG